MGSGFRDIGLACFGGNVNQRMVEATSDETGIAMLRHAQQQDPESLLINPAPSRSGDLAIDSSNNEPIRASTSQDQVPQPEASQSHSAKPSVSGFEMSKIYPVPDHIKPDHPHFKPMALWLGLHTRQREVPLKKPMKKLTQIALHRGMGNFKVQIVQKMVQIKAGEDGGGPSSVTSVEWERFVSEVSQETDAEALYAAPAQDYEAFFTDLLQDSTSQRMPSLEDLSKPQGVLAMDALFLCAYLCFMSSDLGNKLEYELQLEKDWRKIFCDAEFECRKFPLHRDLMMMGNQLPMSLLLAVMKQLIPKGPHVIRTSGEEQLQMRGNKPKAKIHQIALNNIIRDLAVTVYPFSHGDKSMNLIEWKTKLMKNVETHHGPHVEDALWKCSHLLASIYMAICGGDNPIEQEEDSKDYISAIPSASKLKLCGIKFKAIDHPFPFRLDTIVFKNRTLSLPKLVMNDDTASLFRNLALYEQVTICNNRIRYDIRCYLQLMDSLIDTPEDVRLLVQSGVLLNQLGSEEAVSKEWNNIGHGLFKSQYNTLQKRIDAHVRARRNQWRAAFIARNCQTPLHAAAWITFCIVSVATLVQAIIAIITISTPSPQGPKASSPEVHTEQMRSVLELQMGALGVRK